jgi:uncharacterized Zn-binding protein involved in type VI secretion
MIPIARLGDSVACLLPCPPGVILVTQQVRVWVNGKPVATVGDVTSNCLGSPWCNGINYILTGALDEWLEGRPVARVGDICVNGIILTGSIDTL